MNRTSNSFLRMIQTKRQYEDSLLSRKGIIGCGVGSSEQGVLGIVVYASVEHHDVPTELDGVNVFVVEVRPDDKWKNTGHVTVASAGDLDKAYPRSRLACLHVRKKVDAALAAPTPPDIMVPEILGLGIPKGIRVAQIGMEVKKSGRTTSVTEGIVKACDVSLFVDDPRGISGPTLFVEQIATTAMAEPGDSGSLTLDTDLYGIGLLFAQIPGYTFHNSIQNVLKAFEIELWTGEPTADIQMQIDQVRRDYKSGKRRTERWRPVPMGVSIGHYRGLTGTAGCLVKHERTGDVLMLSNDHVIAMTVS